MNVFRNIKRQKFRSFLTILGIAIGTFSVVLIGIISDMGKAIINAELESIGMSGLSITNMSETQKNLSDEVLISLKSSEMVADVTPIMFMYSEVLLKGQEEKAVIMGVDSNADNIISLKLMHGRMINRGDISGCKEICVVDEAFADKIYKRSNIVGKKIEIKLSGKSLKCEVVGVVKTGGNLVQNMMGSYVPGFIYLPYSTGQVYIGSDKFDQIAVKLKENIDTDEAQSSILKNCGINPKKANMLRVDNLSGYKEEFNMILDGVSLILGVIAGISLIVAGLSIMTVMMSSVNERTREIGIKKSIGASSIRIVREFISEAFWLSFIGGSLGTITAFLMGVLGALILNIGVSVNIFLLLGTNAFAIFTGIIFGVYPAIKASKLRPVEALRRE